METEKNVVNINNYGKISINIKKIMQAKKINRNQLCVMTGIKFDTIQKYFLGEVYRVDLDVLARICYALNCEPKEIIEYKY